VHEENSFTPYSSDHEYHSESSRSVEFSAAIRRFFSPTATNLQKHIGDIRW